MVLICIFVYVYMEYIIFLMYFNNENMYYNFMNYVYYY